MICMRIVHIAPTSPYNDYWGYQDNLLPAFHKRMGHEVTVIVSNLTHSEGRIVETECGDYHLDDGVRVIRLSKKSYCHRILTNLNSKLDVYDLLSEIKPDFIFFHGMISSTLDDAVKYKKEISPDCVIVQDNHMDYFNCPYNTANLKGKLIRAFYRRINKRNEKYISRIYGVTPWRKTFAEDFYSASPSKTDVLIMGADDTKMELSHREEIRKAIRAEHGISENAFLVVTGGKIDRAKNILQLMKSCGDADKVKLLIFGSVSDDIKGEFDALLEKYPDIIYIGWIDSDKVYDFFFASDLIAFPGSHSVLWEQACASKSPCLFKRIDGMEHVNNGGNADFVDSADEESLARKIDELLFTEKYYEMKAVAESPATDVFLYSRIAEKSLECSLKG